ncbi:hypothetical protein [Microbacterium jejuense]
MNHIDPGHVAVPLLATAQVATDEPHFLGERVRGIPPLLRAGR